MIKLIAMDMDGTLLTSNNTISKETKETLLEVQKKGIRLALASGRSYTRLMEYAEELQMDQYGGFLIEVNGMAIYDIKTGKRYIKKKMPKENARELFQYFSKWKVEIIGNMDTGMYDYNPKAILEEKKAYLKEHNYPEDFPFTGGAYDFVVDNRAGYPDIRYIQTADEILEDVNKISITYWTSFMDRICEQARADLKDRYWVGRTTPKWLEIMMPDITKANGLRDLSKRIGITMDEIMAFGDGENDIEMLKEVGFGIAMGNAMSEVKKAAKEITATNQEDGIAKAIKKYIL